MKQACTKSSIVTYSRNISALRSQTLSTLPHLFYQYKIHLFACTMVFSLVHALDTSDKITVNAVCSEQTGRPDRHGDTTGKMERCDLELYK